MTAEDYEAILDERRCAAARSDAHGVARRVYHVASVIVRRWEAAGYTTARLVDGLPRPERPHVAEWHVEAWARHCAVCARPWFKRDEPPAMCPGPPAFDLVHEAVARGVPFGMVDGLPTAGVPVVLVDILPKVARATCESPAA